MKHFIVGMFVLGLFLGGLCVGSASARAVKSPEVAVPCMTDGLLINPGAECGLMGWTAGEDSTGVTCPSCPVTCHSMGPAVLTAVQYCVPCNATSDPDYPNSATCPTIGSQSGSYASNDHYPPHNGTNYFWGNVSQCGTLTQNVKLLSTVSVVMIGGAATLVDTSQIEKAYRAIQAKVIDDGNLLANVEFYVRDLKQSSTRYPHESDYSYVSLTFFDANNNLINGSSVSQVPSQVPSPDVYSYSGWTKRTGSFPIPSGTRSISYTMHFIRNCGNWNNSYIDDNSLTITSKPSSP